MRTQKDRALTPHETLEMHELLRSEITGYKKLKTSIIMVEDNELKDFMRESMNSKKENIELMQRFITAQKKLQ